MRINFSQTITDVYGEPISPPPAKDGDPIPAPYTLRSVAINSLLAGLKGDEGMNGERKAALWALAMRIREGDDGDYSIDDVKLIKDRIGAMYFAAIVGRAYQFIEAAASSTVEA